jgi:hypothetical protein
MIYAYGITLTGTYHLKKASACQDAHRIIRVDENFAVAAAADGADFSENSDRAARIAADTAAVFLSESINRAMNVGDILNTLKASFYLALAEIEKTAGDNKTPFDRYETTLLAVVFLDGSLYYAIAGNGGIIALNEEGLYERLTETQQDDEHIMFPLSRKEKWSFGKYARRAASVLLATDGMLETLCPYLLEKQRNPIYVSLARYLMDNALLSVDKKGEESVRGEILSFLSAIPDEDVNDDKTVAVLIDCSVIAKRQDAPYYAEPDWDSLIAKRDADFDMLVSSIKERIKNKT